MTFDLPSLQVIFQNPRNSESILEINVFFFRGDQRPNYAKVYKLLLLLCVLQCLTVIFTART